MKLRVFMDNKEFKEDLKFLQDLKATDGQQLIYRRMSYDSNKKEDEEGTYEVKYQFLQFFAH
jgi:hypothetical protein